MNRPLLSALLAYVLWGAFPLYFRALIQVPAGELLAHRIVSACVFVLSLVAITGGLRNVGQALRQPRLLLSATLSALFLATNWLIYLYAVNSGQTVEASLGYFINPLVNVLLGTVFLGERLRRFQWLSIALAASGVLWLAQGTHHVPFIALALAGSFGLYGLLRKIARLGALAGLAVETLVLLPAALAFELHQLQNDALVLTRADAPLLLGLCALGPATAIPLLLFTHGARHIPLATLGVAQYIAPSLQLLVAILAFHEPFDAARLRGFVLIWMALALYAAEGLIAARLRREGHP